VYLWAQCAQYVLQDDAVQRLHKSRRERRSRSIVLSVMGVLKCVCMMLVQTKTHERAGSYALECTALLIHFDRRLNYRIIITHYNGDITIHIPDIFKATASSSGAVRVKCLAQGHIVTQLGGAWVRTINLRLQDNSISLALPPELN
jgi:hypothetical protein